jgi:hypothetical protein
LITTTLLGPDAFSLGIPANAPYYWLSTHPPRENAEEENTSLGIDAWQPFVSSWSILLQSRLYQHAMPFSALFAGFTDALLGARASNTLGVPPQARFALFGIGPFPALRLEISDPIALESLLLKLAHRASIEHLRQRHAELPYHLFRDRDWRLAVAITPQEALAVLCTQDQLDAALELLLTRVPLVDESHHSHTPLRPQHDPNDTSFAVLELKALADAIAKHFSSDGRDCADALSELSTTISQVSWLSRKGEDTASGVLRALLVKESPTLQPQHPPITLETPQMAYLYSAIALQEVHDWLSTPYFLNNTERCPGEHTLRGIAAQLRSQLAHLPPPTTKANQLFAVLTHAQLEDSSFLQLKGQLVLITNTPASALAEMCQALECELPKLRKRDPGPYALAPVPRRLHSLSTLMGPELLAFSSGEDESLQLPALLANPSQTLQLFSLGFDYGQLLQAYLSSTPWGLDEEQLEAVLNDAARYGQFHLELTRDEQLLELRYELELQASP